jgi:hypothetical protein
MREKRVRSNASLRNADNNQACLRRKTLFELQQDARAPRALIETQYMRHSVEGQIREHSVMEMVQSVI